MSDHDSGWLTVDEQTDVVVSLWGCAHCLSNVELDPVFWKHVIVNLHNATQGAMVCHLSGTAQVGALDENSSKKINEWHDRDRKGEIDYFEEEEDGLSVRRARSPKDEFPKSRLADPSKLFGRLNVEEERMEPAGELLILSESQQNSFTKLHRMRNDFSHFTPKGWSIELAGLPGICLDVLAIVEMIVEDGWGFRHLNEDRSEQLRDLLRSIGQKLKQLGCQTV